MPAFFVFFRHRPLRRSWGEREGVAQETPLADRLLRFDPRQVGFLLPFLQPFCLTALWPGRRLPPRGSLDSKF